MKNGTSIACAMARRTRISDEFLAAEVELEGVGAGVASLPLVETIEALVLVEPRRCRRARAPLNGLSGSRPASIGAAAADLSVITRQTMRSR